LLQKFPTMAEVRVKEKYFDHLVEYRLPICKECQHGVWPDQIKGHLQGVNHKLSRKEASLIGEAVRNWAGLIRYPSELEVPNYVNQPISQLPLYKDGLLCTLNLDRCHYVCRGPKYIKEHWRKAHQWSISARRGGSGRAKGLRIERRFQEGAKSIQCQRFFVSRHGSQYFEVRQAEESLTDETQAVPVDGEALWAQLRKKVTGKWASIEKRAQTTIQKGEKDEVNPWLERTQWEPYLEGMERPDLIACISEPNVDPKGDEEPVEAAIWEAMDELARFSQTSVIERIGVFVRMEAIRTEKHQMRYQPLQPYMDEKSIGEHTRPWKQILMFFARTQREHEWKSPECRFTRRQREAWEALVDEAERKVDGKEDEMDKNK
jgi:hypothetical protein